MNLYLSEFEVGEGIRRPSACAEAIDTVLAFCAGNSVHCWRSGVCEDYSRIEHRIDSSDIFVAIIDRYWKSSTWKAHEFTYASGGAGHAGGVDGKIVARRIAFVVDGERPFLRGSPAGVRIVHSIPELEDALAHARLT